MKFILDGYTFDTEKSTELAYASGTYIPFADANGWDKDAERVDYEHTLYRTESNLLFVWSRRHATFDNLRNPTVSNRARRIATEEEAVQWIAANRAAVYDDAGLPMPETV